ncbi:hypothetical protein GCM10027020_09800 [Nocardioides salsibiostraticola]
MNNALAITNASHWLEVGTRALCGIDGCPCIPHSPCRFYDIPPNMTQVTPRLGKGLGPTRRRPDD